MIWSDGCSVVEVEVLVRSVRYLQVAVSPIIVIVEESLPSYDVLFQQIVGIAVPLPPDLFGLLLAQGSRLGELGDQGPVIGLVIFAEYRHIVVFAIIIS